MTFKTENGWIMHGESVQSTLIGGVLPARGVHFLVGPEKGDNSAIAVDLAVAIAAGDVGCGLGPADKEGFRASLAGFFGLPTGTPCGVGIVS